MLENLRDNGINLRMIFIVFIVLVLSLIAIIVFISPSGGYLIVNESLILTNKRGRWSQISSLNKDVLSKKYSVYSSTGKTSNVSLNYSSNEWYYYDENYTDLSLKKVQAAYTKEFKKLKVAKYDVDFYNDNDDVYLKKIIGNKKIDTFKNSVIKSSYDLDNDGIIETIYTITNQSLESGGGNFSSIFLVEGDSFAYKLDSDTKSPFLVRNIIDLDGNGKYEIIVSKGTVDVATFDTCYQIYSISGGKIKKIKDC